MNQILTAPGGGKSVKFAADGKTAGVTVTDAAGYVWTLSVPADALLNPRTITLTPMDSLDSSGSKVAVTSGVLLTARHDGSALRFAETESADGSLSAPLWHFSAGALAGGDDMAPIISAAREEYQAAKAAALALGGGNSLRSRQVPLGVLPTPPSASTSCSGSTDDATKAKEAQEIDRFMKALSQPEGDVLRRLLGAERAMARLGEDTGTEGMDIAARLAERVVWKAERLMEQFGDDPEKFPVLAQALLSSARAFELLGGETVDLTPLAQRARQNRDRLLTKLRNEHDYSVVQALFEMERLSQALGMEDDDFLEKLGKALVFKLSIDHTSDADGSAGDAHFATQGEITVRHLRQRESRGTPWEWEGNGRISLLKGEYVGQKQAVLVTPDGFEYRAGLNNMDACIHKTVDIVMDYPYGKKSGNFGTFVVGSTQVTMPIFIGDAVLACKKENILDENLMKNGFMGMTFTVPLRNKQAEAVSETVSCNLKTAKDTFHFRLTHTPE